MKKFVFPALIVCTLCACHAKPELREDIKEFISQFSLEAAFEQYKTGGYTSKETTTEGETKKTVVIELEYTLTDENHPTYVRKTTNYVDDVQASLQVVSFVENEEGTFLSTDGTLEPYSVQDCKNLITKFFYKQVDLDGTYHTRGFYYGDYLKEVAPALQDYVTIDQENELYIMEYSKTVKQEGVTLKKTQKYSINKYGMLVENHDKNETSTKTITTDITVHN